MRQRARRSAWPKAGSTTTSRRCASASRKPDSCSRSTSAAAVVQTCKARLGARLAALRKPLHRGEVEFAAICRDFGLRLAADRLSYIAHWVTPVGRAKRFDTRFFVAALPDGQARCTMPSSCSTMSGCGRPGAGAGKHAPPDDADPRDAGNVGPFADTEAVLAWARSLREVRKVMPRLGYDSTGLRPVRRTSRPMPSLAASRLLGQSNGWCEMRPGVAGALVGAGAARQRGGRDVTTAIWWAALAAMSGP